MNIVTSAGLRYSAPIEFKPMVFELAGTPTSAEAERSASYGPMTRTNPNNQIPVSLASVGVSHIVPAIAKRRKFSDLTLGDTAELLYKFEEFRSNLDEGDENLPAGLIDKPQELRDNLEDIKNFLSVEQSSTETLANEYPLGDPTTALTNPAYIEGPMTSNIFEAKLDNVRAALPQVVIAVASYCQLQGGVVTSGEQQPPPFRFTDDFPPCFADNLFRSVSQTTCTTFLGLFLLHFADYMHMESCISTIEEQFRAMVFSN
ncbi:uncharacterized protein BJ212DRAFT_1300526 [Suillus subaureus]|uniref:Uncharacterized protein n=1 Tax=Suillus subaureus TaxID=48587 RepID=A0A9P7E8Y4_9AGAM|nr:uncharacterized protein BJ212DRAFT_1300526 [Suillus subaureus]KAG1814743.1 hypothetical protein BJ212DRAFT_1300526 [Suillus subaureus]